MNSISKVWLSSSFLFDPVQKFFNGNFWVMFEKKFGKFSNKKVLDIACGTGELKKHIKPKYYLGIDINSSYIEYCKKRYSNQNVEFEKKDASKIKLEKIYDTIFFVGSIHHFSNKQLEKLLNNLNSKKVKQLIICDGIPTGFFKPLLVWLDDFLGEGKYFRNEKELSIVFEKNFKIKKSGRLKTLDSFYVYPYWVLSPRHK